MRKEKDNNKSHSNDNNNNNKISSFINRIENTNLTRMNMYKIVENANVLADPINLLLIFTFSHVYISLSQKAATTDKFTSLL